VVYGQTVRCFQEKSCLKLSKELPSKELVVIDQETGTRDPNSASFLLLNVDYDQEVEVDGGMIWFKEVDTDVFTSGEWKSITSYKFHDGSTNIPQDLPTLVTNRNYMSIGFKAVGLLFCGIIFVLSIGFGLWAYINRNRQKVLRSSQPFFLYVISAGTTTN
jgi:hypothetical protein